MAKIFINPGHSKNCNPDPGATNGIYKEATIAADIAEALSTKLMAQGIETIVYQQHEGLTSNAQLNNVPKVANESKADLFLSIHLNSASSTAKGTETLCHSSSRDGLRFANLINNELSRPFDNYTFTNRGVKQDIRGLLVLNATNMPAALTEIGFISNANDITFIIKHIDDIAQRLCNAVCNYFGIKQKQIITDTSKHTDLKITIEQDHDRLYNCYVNGTQKLKCNRLSSCLQWIEDNYA